MSSGHSYLLVSLRKSTLPGGESIQCDGCTLTCLAVEESTAESVKVGTKWIKLPKNHQSAVLVEDRCGNWVTIVCDHKDNIDETSSSSTQLKLFLIHGVWSGLGPVGVRTSIDWELTHWGTRLNHISGVWFIPCMLPSEDNQHLEFKAVQRGEDITWEQPAFCNKQIELRTQYQVILGRWGVENVESTIIVPNYKKNIQVEVEIPYDVHRELVSPKIRTHHLVIRDCRGPYNNRLFNKGHQALLKYDHKLRRYVTKLPVDRNLDRMKFKLAIVDDDSSISHLDHLSFANEDSRPRSRLVDFNNIAVVKCAYFVDVRPFKWCIEHSDMMSTLPVHIKAVYELLTEPIKDKYKVKSSKNKISVKIICDNSAICRKSMVIAGDLKLIMEEQKTT